MRTITDTKPLKDIAAQAAYARTTLEKKFKHLRKEDCEDFESFCCEQYLLGRDLRTSFNYLMIDYFRKFGVSKPRKNSDDSEDTRNVDLMNQPHRVKETALKNVKAPSAQDRSMFTQRYRTKDLDLVARASLILHLEWGFSYAEIADTLGYTVAYISQVMKKALNTQKKRLLNESKL